jgi:hypothetical protein
MTAREENKLKSPNFAFLEIHQPQLVRLGTLAEQYFAADSMVVPCQGVPELHTDFI